MTDGQAILTVTDTYQSNVHGQYLTLPAGTEISVPVKTAMAPMDYTLNNTQKRLRSNAMQAYKLIGTTQHANRELVDGGSSITFHTVLLSDDLYINCRHCNGQVGDLMFIPEGCSEMVTNENSFPNLPEQEETKKQLSPSQIMRLKIHKLWEMEGKPGDKEEHYIAMMKRIGIWIDKLTFEAEAKNGL